MNMANAKILHLVPNAIYIQRYQHVGIFALGDAKVHFFALGDAKVPNANGFTSQWNIGYKVREGRLSADFPKLYFKDRVGRSAPEIS